MFSFRSKNQKLFFDHLYSKKGTLRCNGRCKGKLDLTKDRSFRLIFIEKLNIMNDGGTDNENT